MKRTLTTIAALLTAVGTTHAFEIKGIRPGMTEQELKEGPLASGYYQRLEGEPIMVGRTGPTKLTVGGAQAMVLVIINESKVDLAEFEFKRNEFDEVREAVTGKYPHLVCKTTEGKNAYGGPVVDKSCQGKDDVGELRLFTLPGKTLLQLVTHDNLARQKARTEGAKKDV